VSYHSYRSRGHLIRKQHDFQPVTALPSEYPEDLSKAYQAKTDMMTKWSWWSMWTWWLNDLDGLSGRRKFTSASAESPSVSRTNTNYQDPSYIASNITISSDNVDSASSQPPKTNKWLDTDTTTAVVEWVSSHLMIFGGWLEKQDTS